MAFPVFQRADGRAIEDGVGALIALAEHGNGDDRQAIGAAGQDFVAGCGDHVLRALQQELQVLALTGGVGDFGLQPLFGEVAIGLRHVHGDKWQIGLRLVTAMKRTVRSGAAVGERAAGAGPPGAGGDEQAGKRQETER